MKVIGWILTAVGAVLALSLAVNYRPGAVVGERVDPSGLVTLDGARASLAEYRGRVLLLAFSTDG